MADKDDSGKLDQILAHCEAIGAKHDALSMKHDALCSRMDALETTMGGMAQSDAAQKAKWDAAEKEKEEKAKADAAAKADAEEKMKADAAAKEEDDKKKADAAEKEEEEKKKADAAKADAAKGAASDEVLKRIAELERSRTANHTDEDKARFAEVQMRADAGFQAWGEQAAPALAGESLADYRVRLANKLKKHSKVYKDSNLSLLVADPSAFGVIETQIIADAVSASNNSVAENAPLQKRTRRTESGHTEVRWVGDPSVWAATYMGGATRFGKLNRNPQA